MLRLKKYSTNNSIYMITNTKFVQQWSLKILNSMLWMNMALHCLYLVLRLETNLSRRQRTSQFSSMSRIGMLQLAPSIDHQISAMFSILER